MAGYEILLVDDEERVINSLIRTLRSMDTAYTFYTALSAEEAMKIAQARKPHLIICDYQLGGMNGMEFLSKISQNYPEIIAILLTGHAELNAAIEAINKAVLYKFIVKPWDNEELRITVQRALEHRAAISENKKLLSEIRKKDEYISQLEKQHPNITSLKRDSAGHIVIDP
jgi:DNA-binding NtrC family response regulator